MRFGLIPILVALSLSACGPGQLASSTKDEPSSRTLKVLSYNAYQLNADPNAKPTLDARRAFLADELAATGADVVIIQEVWSTAARADLAMRMSARGYVGVALEKKSVIPPYFYGNGLYVYVKSTLGTVAAPQMAIFAWGDMINYDYVTNKGALKVRIDVPGIGPIDVIAGHSSYLAFSPATQTYAMEKEPKLLNQIHAIGELMNQDPAPLQIFGADLNTHPTVWRPEAKAFDETEKSNVYKILTEELGLVDTMAEGGCTPCFTWDNDHNGLIRQGLFGGSQAEPNQRIDYLMYRGAGVEVASSVLALQDDHVFGTGEGEKRLPLSDHFGVLTTLEITTVP